MPEDNEALEDSTIEIAENIVADLAKQDVITAQQQIMRRINDDL